MTDAGRHKLHVLIVVLLALLAYAPSLGNDFPFDDTLASAKTSDQGPDRVIGEAHSPFFFFTQHYWAGENKNSHLYRPVTILSYALTHHAWAKHLAEPKPSVEIGTFRLDFDQAFPHHLINLLLGAWAAFLVLWMMRDVGMCATGAFLTAALFAVHALHSEVIAGIVGRAELFSFCFGATALQCFRRAAAGRAVLWLPLAGLFTFFAICSKESAFAWLPFIPCYLAARAWQRGEKAGDALRAHVRGLAFVFVPVLVLYFVLRANAIADMREDVFYAANPLYHEPFVVRILTAIKIVGYAIWKCVAPFSLASNYGLPAIPLVDGFADPGFLAAAAVIGVWLFAGLSAPSRRPLLFLSVAIFFGFSFVTSNIPIAIGTIFGERLYYIPSLGVCMLPALLVPHVGDVGRRVVAVICVVWGIGNLVVDWQRCLVWRDNVTLLILDSATQPNCASLQVKAATMHRWLQKQPGQDEAYHEKEAWRLLRLGRELDPEYVSGIATEASFLGQDEKHDEALHVLQQALQSKRLPISGLEASIRADLGMLLIQQKNRKREGLAQLLRAVTLRPGNLPYRMAFLDHGIPILKDQRERMRQMIIEGREMFPREIMMVVLEAAFLHEHGERSPTVWRHIADSLGQVFRAVPEDATKQRRYITARVHFADALAALGRPDDARREYEFVLQLAEAKPEQKALAQRGLSRLPK